MNDTSTTIEVGDTVRLEGRRGRGVVEALKPGKVTISYMWRPRGGGYHDRGVSVGDYAASRVVLVRKGNADQDACDELFADMDRRAAERAAATCGPCGTSLAGHIENLPCVESPPRAVGSLHNLPIAAWAWSQDGQDSNA